MYRPYWYFLFRLTRKKRKAVTCNGESSPRLGAARAACDAADVLSSVSLYDAHQVKSDEAKLERCCSPRTYNKQPFLFKPMIYNKTLSLEAGQNPWQEDDYSSFSPHRTISCQWEDAQTVRVYSTQGRVTLVLRSGTRTAADPSPHLCYKPLIPLSPWAN